MCLQIAYQRLWTRKSQCHTAESMAFDHDKNGQRSDLASLEWHVEARTLAQDLLHPGSCFHVAPAFFRISHPQGPSPSRSRIKVFSYKPPSLGISPLALLAQPGFWQLGQQSSLTHPTPIYLWASAHTTSLKLSLLQPSSYDTFLFCHLSIAGIALFSDTL